VAIGILAAQRDKELPAAFISRIDRDSIDMPVSGIVPAVPRALERGRNPR